MKPLTNDRTRIGEWLRLACAGVLLVAATSVVAQQTPSQFKDTLTGTTWTLVTVYNEQDGKRTEPFGPNPKGVFMLDRSGRFVQFFLRDGLPKFASNNRATGTPDENKAVVTGSNAYFGTYSISDKEPLMTLQIEGSTFPNWDGVAQKRLIVLKGDELTLTNPTAAVGGTGVSVWKRAK
jgi:hypothetical protein